MGMFRLLSELASFLMGMFRLLSELASFLMGMFRLLSEASFLMGFLRVESYCFSVMAIVWFVQPILFLIDATISETRAATD